MNTKHFLLTAVLVMATTAGLAGCKSTNPLDGTDWVLAGLNGVSASAETTVIIAFDDGKVGGTDGCNRYSSGYSVKGSNITVDKNVTSTLMACSGEIMNQATQFVQALMDTKQFQITDNRLTLMDGEKNPLAVFVKQDKTLGGTSWKVTGYNNGQQAVISPLEGTEITLDFSQDGKVSGMAGCNRYTASYSVDGQSIVIGPAASTKMMCLEPAGVMEQESAFLQVLSTAATFRLEGDQLELRSGDGAIDIQLVQTQ